MIEDPDEPDWKLTDLELAQSLGIADDPRWPKVVKGLAPGYRRKFEALELTYREIRLWEQGLGPLPAGVMVDPLPPRNRRKPTGQPSGRPRSPTSRRARASARRSGSSQ